MISKNSEGVRKKMCSNIKKYLHYFGVKMKNSFENTVSNNLLSWTSSLLALYTLFIDFLLNYPVFGMAKHFYID